MSTEPHRSTLSRRERRSFAGTAPEPLRARGFSLVELLVAMTLGLFLISGLVAVFAGNKRSGDINTAMTDMQESVRFALNTIAGDIRMAGHQGCLDFNGGAADVIAKRPPTADYLATAVSGARVETASSWKPALALGSGTDAFTPPTVNTAVPGTHVIALQFGGPIAVPLRAAMNTGGVPDANAVLELDGDIGVRQDDLALISTCEDGEVFRVSAVSDDGVVAGRAQTSLSHAATHNTRANFIEPYGRGGTQAQVLVMPFSTHVYYVGETGSTNERGDPIRALFQQSMPFNDSDNPPVELVRGVENLRLSFGIGGNGGQLRYVTVDDSAYDPRQVRSVRVGVLMASFDHIASDDDTTVYVLAGQSIAPATSPTDASAYKADKRFRLAFNTTVKVRNRRAFN